MTEQGKKLVESKINRILLIDPKLIVQALIHAKT